MKQELEIEYKNLLTRDEYQEIFKGEFSNNTYDHKIKQTNHYFDTKEKLLKQNQSAVRIRISESLNELTFKVPAQDFLMETNIPLSTKQVNSILFHEQFSLSDITSQSVDLGISVLTNQTIFKHFNQFKTFRYEKRVGNNLMVLDQTTFQNNFIDYELEVESQNPIEGKEFFNTLLMNYSIPLRPTLPKIARAEKNN